MKNFAILCSIVYCGIFCHTLYSQNITDSAITAVKDMQADTVDNVTVKIKKIRQQLYIRSGIFGFCST